MDILITKTNSIAVILAALFLVGCASATKVMSPNGKPGYSVECNGTAVSMTACYEKAAEVCPKGYIVVNQENRSGFIANQFYVGGTSHKGIFVECKD